MSSNSNNLLFLMILWVDWAHLSHSEYTEVTELTRLHSDIGLARLENPDKSCTLLSVYMCCLPKDSLGFFTLQPLYKRTAQFASVYKISTCVILLLLNYLKKDTSSGLESMYEGTTPSLCLVWSPHTIKI